jgi:mitofusin
MAANVNHTISLTDGNDLGIGGPSLAVGQMGNAGSICDSSPLQDFVRAKKNINDIFVEIEDYVRDTVTFMESKYKEELT